MEAEQDKSVASAEAIGLPDEDDEDHQAALAQIEKLIQTGRASAGNNGEASANQLIQHI